METTCAGCGVEPRSGRSRLGKACLAAARKAARVGQPVGHPVSDMSDRGVSDTVSDMRREIEMLRDEVGRLKGLLAEANGKVAGLAVPVVMPSAGTGRIERSEVVRGGRVLTPPKEAMGGHPLGRCFKSACWCKVEPTEGRRG